MRWVKLLLILILVGLPGCVENTWDFSTVKARMYDSGATIEGTVGEVISLLLDSNATTGYQWLLAATPDDAVIMLVGSEYQPPAETIPGRGGQEKWVFKATGPGTTELTFQYVRPWQPEEAVRTMRYTVTIR